MVKMGFFCALFILPNVIELVCQCYKFMILTQWTRMTIDCKQQSGACHRPTPPQAEIYMTAVISSLATGFSCLMWVLSAKTVHAWKNFIFCGMCSSAPVKVSKEMCSIENCLTDFLLGRETKICTVTVTIQFEKNIS